MLAEGGRGGVEVARGADGVTDTLGCGWIIARRPGRLVVRGLGVFDQHPMVGARVEEADHARQPFARGLVDHLDAGLAGRDQIGGDIGRLETDVMKTLAAIGQIAGDAAVRIDGLDQFDLGVVEREQHTAHTLLLDDAILGDGQAERVAPEAQRGICVGHDGGNMMQPSQGHRVSSPGGSTG